MNHVVIYSNPIQAMFWNGEADIVSGALVALIVGVLVVGWSYIQQWLTKR